jgi:DNA-binding NtrC family response regulator
LDLLDRGGIDAVVTDLRMRPPDGMALLATIRERWPATIVVMMTAYAALETAREALKQGAQDYVEKEGDYVDLIVRILREAGERLDLRQSNASLTATVEGLRRETLPVVGDAPATRAALDMARKVAVTDSTVLLRGESGTGKDLFARTLHALSKRAGGPWVKVNCGALPEALLESELFGHEKGAFTGAVKQKDGRVRGCRGRHVVPRRDRRDAARAPGEAAAGDRGEDVHACRRQSPTDGGRAHHRRHEPSARGHGARAHVPRGPVLPTQRVPDRAAAAARAPRDVPRLVEHVLRRHGAPADKIEPAAMRALEGYPFPGNVRELEHTLERALILAGADPITTAHLSFAQSVPAVTAGPSSIPRIPEDGLSLETLERELILQALERAAGNKSAAARLLGLTRRTLYSRMEKHGLHTPGEGDESDAD